MDELRNEHVGLPPPSPLGGGQDDSTDTPTILCPIGDHVLLSTQAGDHKGDNIEAPDAWDDDLNESGLSARLEARIQGLNTATSSSLQPFSPKELRQWQMQESFQGRIKRSQQSPTPFARTV